MAYVTLSQLKTRLGISDSSHDAQLQTVLDGAIGIAESITGRNFGAEKTVTDELYDMDTFTNTRNNWVIMLRNMDITSVQSVKINDTVLDSGAYKWNPSGRLVLIGGWFDRANRSWDDYDIVKVSYKYFASTPAAVNEAIYQIAAGIYNNRIDAIKKETIGRYTYELGAGGDNGALPPDVLKVLKSYRIRRV